MAQAIRERQSAYASPLTRADLERLRQRLDVHLGREAERIRTVRGAGGQTSLLERRWTRLLTAYERLSNYLEARSA